MNSSTTRRGPSIERVFGVWRSEPRAYGTARTWLSGPAPTIARTATVEEAQMTAALANTHHLAVVDPAGELVGVLCQQDLARTRGEVKVYDVMRRAPTTVDAATPIPDVARLMALRHVGCLPVLAGRHPLGLITREELRRADVLTGEDAPTCEECGTCYHVRIVHHEPAPSSFVCVACLKLSSDTDQE